MNKDNLILILIITAVTLFGVAIGYTLPWYLELITALLFLYALNITFTCCSNNMLVIVLYILIFGRIFFIVLFMFLIGLITGNILV